MTKPKKNTSSNSVAQDESNNQKKKHYILSNGNGASTTINLDAEISGVFKKFNEEIRILNGVKTHNIEQLKKKEQFIESIRHLQSIIREDIRKKLSENLPKSCLLMLDLENPVCQAILKDSAPLQTIKDKNVDILVDNISKLKNESAFSLAKETVAMLDKLQYDKVSKANNAQNYRAITEYGNKQFAEHNAPVRFLKNIFSMVCAGLYFVCGVTKGIFEAFAKCKSPINNAAKHGAEAYQHGKDFGKHLMFQTPAESVEQKGRKYIEELRKSLEHRETRQQVAQDLQERPGLTC